MTHQCKTGGWLDSTRLRASSLGFLIAALLCGPAAAQCTAGNPDPTPILRIETGMHSAVIWRIGADAQCRLLATGSEDKTMRLWSTDGKPLRTQRLPIGPGDEGKVYSVAVSPDWQQEPREFNAPDLTEGEPSCQENSL
jgi:hypothetical protein